MADPRLKQAISNKEYIVAPGVYDMISARMADRMDFKALYVTGYGTVASYLGLPDAGIATYTDMIVRVGRIAQMSSKPVIADADTGYGGLLNVHHTVRGYEAAGVSAIQLEDQEFPKKCGHTPNRRVVPVADMVKKIKVANDARSSGDFLIIARTDARTSLGLDEAIRRAEAYAEAGADILFVESPETVDEMAEIGRRLDKPLVANMANGGKTPILPARDLEEMGFAISIFPGAGFLATAAALDIAYSDLLENGTTTDRTNLYSFAEFTNMIGFPEVWEFDKKYAE
ncbi:isocitrate lyase/PEP mutase family protein (plasmid) [Skermanella mucosa]|uniref:isocitrate lyase/PEP mutase family protein n=1 Tax=Skermanella mucosa TaxID=1789672 RepID=UPI00192AADF0|nr:isocitrate lyase/PEP mutase family protein [Skermanella mucosa]UEM24424.1 isocitrate lyase/PEP mutase family protein [Skermanella mucosa]